MRMSSCLENPGMINAMKQLIVVMQVTMDMMMNPACKASYNQPMHGKMDARGDKTMTVKEMNRKSRRTMKKTMNLPAGDGNSKSKVPRKPVGRSKQTQMDCNKCDEGPKSSKLPTRRNLGQAAGRQMTKMVCPPFETHDTHRLQALGKMKKNFDTMKPEVPKKRQRRSTAKPVAPIVKKTIRRARQTIRKRAAATRMKTAVGKQARVC